MNLMNYFNFKFLKENIKKAKGALAFILCLLPVTNLLLLIAFYGSNENIINFSTMSTMTYIVMFIVPIILSYLLFGFLFKKKSVDFYLSKPISRKSIYFTNIVGGIIIILIFTIINTLIFGLFGLFTSIAMPIKLLLDYFVYWFISYVFMFIVTSLSITLAGNFISAAVIIIIMICLFPFLNFVNTTFAGVNTSYIYCDNNACMPDNYLTCNDSTCLEHKAKNEFEFRMINMDSASYSAPYSFLKNELVRCKDVVKMLVLSIIYAIIGCFTFMKRKMENCECSFKNEIVHYLVKTFTFLPFAFITYVALMDSERVAIWLICILGSFCYYFIYDLITRKGIYKFKKSTLVWAISLALLIGFYSLWYNVNQREKVYKIPDQIIITNEKDYGYITIKDKEVINALIKETIEQDYSEDYYAMNYSAILKIGNKEYSASIIGNSNVYSIIAKYIEDNNIKNIYEGFNYDNLDYVSLGSTNLKIDNELISILKASANKSVNTENNYYMYYALYVYENHDYSTIYIPMDITQELAQYSTNYFNNNYMEKMNNKKFDSYTITTRGDSTIDSYIFALNYIINKYNDEFKEYFNKHLIDTANSERHYLITSYDGKISYYYFVNDVDSFNELYLKYYEQCLSDTDFLNRYGYLLND